MEKVIRSFPLATQVEKILRERILSGYYPPNSQIPAEEELAKELNVSRATVRSALSTLTANGKIIRIHGVGTFVSNLPHILNPLDQLIDFQDLFAMHGHQPKVEYVNCSLQEANFELASALDLSISRQVLVSEKIFTADDAPSIYCVNSIPVEIFPKALLDTILEFPASLEPLFDYLERNLGYRVAYMHSKVYALSACKIKFRTPLPCKKSTPVLVLDEIAYTEEGKPLFHTYEYHPERRMDFELIRKRNKS